MADRQPSAADRQPDLAQHLPSDIRCLGVFSGKGGVGKSLVAGLLATAFARKGHPVGILDADVTGPSIPRMFGVRRAVTTDSEGLAPALSHDLGIRIMSLNLLMEKEDDPVVWRGPLVSNTVEQFVTDVDWSGVRYLFIDLPPGTSDVPLTVMQRLPLNGVMIVSSPQELVGMIVRKAIKMAALLNVPVVGLIQNMTHVVCPKCNSPIELFHREQGADAVPIEGVRVLASIPIDPSLSAHCDRGTLEAYLSNPFDDLVELIAESLDGQGPPHA